MAARNKKMRMEDETTSYSGFFEGLDKHQDETPRKRTWEDHVVFSDDEEDAMDPLGYARNAVQRVVTSTPHRPDDGESGESLHFSPQRKIVKAKRKSATVSNPLSSTAKEWGQSLSSWNLSAISSSSGHNSRHALFSSLQNVSAISTRSSTHEQPQRDMTLPHHTAGESEEIWTAPRNDKTQQTQIVSPSRPLHSTGLPNCPSFVDWDVSAISTRSSREITFSTSRLQTSSQNVPYPSLFNLSSRSASSKKNFQCRICARPFPYKGHATAHPTTHMGKSELVKAGVYHLECKECHKIFFHKGNYNRHIQSHEPKASLKCKDCEKEFSRHSHLSRHLFIHMTPEEKAEEMRKWKWGCYFCEKRLRHSSHLERHMPKHTTEKAFPCNQCQSSFARNSQLTVHKRTHSIENPSLACDACGKRFSRSSYVATHKQAVHDGDKHFQCPRCNMAFALKTTMVKHLNAIHLKLRYICKKCPKSFSQPSVLQKHTKKNH